MQMQRRLPRRTIVLRHDKPDRGREEASRFPRNFTRAFFRSAVLLAIIIASQSPANTRQNSVLRHEIIDTPLVPMQK